MKVKRAQLVPDRRIGPRKRMPRRPLVIASPPLPPQAHTGPDLPIRIPSHQFPLPPPSPRHLRLDGGALQPGPSLAHHCNSFLREPRHEGLR